MQEITYNLINERYKSDKPFIVTTNLGSDQILNPKTLEIQRIMSRLFENTILLKVDGEDRRKKRMLEQSQDEIRKLLNS